MHCGVSTAVPQIRGGMETLKLETLRPRSSIRVVHGLHKDRGGIIVNCSFNSHVYFADVVGYFNAETHAVSIVNITLAILERSVTKRLGVAREHLQIHTSGRGHDIVEMGPEGAESLTDTE